MGYELTFDDCRNCGVKPGSFHLESCEIERCPTCSGQYAFCGCARIPTLDALPWTGLWPGELEAIELGLWCRWGPPWIKCNGDHPDARPDLNAWCGLGYPATPAATAIVSEAKALACRGKLNSPEKTARLSAVLRALTSDAN